jgi:hypothetical protein
VILQYFTIEIKEDGFVAMNPKPGFKALTATLAQFG